MYYVRSDDEKVYTSETSVYFNETTQGHIPEGCHIHTSHSDKLKFDLLCFINSLGTNFS
jgi:hypothetical protein